MPSSRSMGIFATSSALLLTATVLDGCASWSCSGWEKLRPSVHDTDGTKKQILEHNNFGRAQSCWQ
jgi:hypothetical protein